MPRFAAFVLVLVLAPVAAAQESAAQVPAWFTEHVEYLVADGGTWITDNSAYKNDDEPYDAYELVWTHGIGKRSAIGVMRAITDGKRSGKLWEFRLFWHPGDKTATLEQFHWYGIYGIGTIQSIDATHHRSEQRFYQPDGSVRVMAHDWTTDSNRQHTTVTQILEGDTWKSNRTYVWMRSEPPPAGG